MLEQALIVIDILVVNHNYSTTMSKYLNKRGVCLKSTGFLFYAIE